MKKTVLLLVLAFGTMTLFAQKKTNGTVYIEHPAINVVNDFMKAIVSGDEAKINSLLTADFRGFNGVSIAYGDSGMTKKAFVTNTLRYHNEFDYFSLEDYPGSYPDAIEYKKDNKNEEVFVQNWVTMKGMHKVTGVKLDQPAHLMFTLTKDNKIKNIVSYSNESIFDEIGLSTTDRTNGKIYNHHDNINTVRKSMYAFEKGDLDKCLSYYSDSATFYDINNDYGKNVLKKDIKAEWKAFLDAFEIKNIEVIGYPDYLEYEMSEGREVLSWWKFNLVRKSDKKAIPLIMHISNGFDKNGKIDSEITYYSAAVLSK